VAERDELGFLSLLRVLIAPSQTDDEVRVLALEIYEDGFIIRWALPAGMQPPESGEEAAMNPMGLTSLTLRDDLGTSYEMVGMTGGGGRATQGFTLFTPPIPSRATWLDVLVKAGFVRFELQPAE
jgi:hypothetical protein